MADLMSRGPQSAAAYLKQEFRTDKGKQQLDSLLSNLLKPYRTFDEGISSWCLWLIAGGQNPEEYLKYLRHLNSSLVCGLVWNANFVAYRCRDCAISPCMSLCADCFQKGNHEGHDFNMFRSQAGGACDCGDESVMKSEGFCTEHRAGESRPLVTPPEDCILLPRAIIPRLFLKLYQYFKDQRLHALHGGLEILFALLNRLSEIDSLRSIMVNVMLSKIPSAIPLSQHGPRHRSTFDLKPVYSATTGRAMIPSIAATVSSYTSEFDTQSEDMPKSNSVFSREDSDQATLAHTDDFTITYLDYLMDTLVQLEFPNSLATFLLRLLPDQEYKVMFTRLFCQHYHRIGETLRGSSSPEDLSNHVVHVSVQLFSSEQLALQMVEEEKLLESMCTVLVTMIQHCVDRYEYIENNDVHTTWVADCETTILKKHCYWPIACDLINILSHNSVVKVFFSTEGIIQQWLHCTTYLTGMNMNERRILSHVEFESRIYHTAFSVEFELVAAVMWELHRGCYKLGDSKYCCKMVKELLYTIPSWLEGFPKASRSVVTFHLALHRYLALFLSQAISHFQVNPVDVLPPLNLITQLFEFPLRTLVALNEVKSGYWVYNGYEMRCQAQSYVQSHFCNSMVDLDIFFVQMTASVMDPDYFLTTVADRFGLMNWFRFGKPKEGLHPYANSMKEMAMIEGFLNFILIVLGHRVYSGSNEARELRKDIAAQLCVADATHSKLSDLIPGRPGDSHICMQDFETVLGEIAFYRSPNFESGSLQQGTYSPKGIVWENEFDLTHIQLRCYSKTSHQDALERYKAHFRSKGRAESNNCWPYPRELEPICDAFAGVFNLLHCKTLHQIIFFVLHKAVEDPSSVSEHMLISVIHLIHLCLNTQRPQKVPDFHPVAHDAGISIAVKCLDFLDEHAPNERSVYSEDSLLLTDLQTDLFEIMRKDPTFNLDPRVHTGVEVNRTLLYVVFTSCYYPLFMGMVNYMNNLLGEIISPDSILTNVHIKMDQLHSVLSMLSTPSFTLLFRLLQHWKRVSRLEGKPVRDFPFPVKRAERIAFSILMNFLTRNFDWLFQVVTPKEGYPAHAFDIEYPSTSIVDNVAVLIGGKEKPQESVNEDTLRRSSSQKDPFSSPDNIREDLVTELKSIIECSEERARQLLKKFDNNIEFAVCMVMDGQEQIEMEVTEERETDTSTSQPTPMEVVDEDTASARSDVSLQSTDCILSLLIKLRGQLLSSARDEHTSTARDERHGKERIVGDGSFYIGKLLNQFCSQSTDCATLMAKLCPNDFQLFDSKNSGNMDSESAAKKLRKKRAAERQQLLLQEFAQRQKNFLENHASGASGGDEEAIEVDQEDSHPNKKEYNCVICGISSPSTEDRPFGLVILMQPTTNLSHRCESLDSGPVDGSSLISVPTNKCSDVVERRKRALLNTFEKVPSVRALEIGLDCGTHMQTCGHYLHVDCQQRYFRALKDEQERDILQFQPIIFHTNRGYYTCPLCRQIGNGFLPILPEDLKKISSEGEDKSATITSRISRLLGKYLKKGRLQALTARSLSLSILSVAYSTTTDSMGILLKDGGSMVTSLYSDRNNKGKFFILLAAIRANLELELQRLRKGGSNTTPQNSFIGTLLEAIHFHCLSLENPMVDLWEQLKDPVSFQSKNSSPTSRLKPPILLYDVTSLLLLLYLTWPNFIREDEYFCLVQHLFNLRYVQGIMNICFSLQGDEKKLWEERNGRLHFSETSPTLDTILALVANSLAGINTDTTSHVAGISTSVLSPKTIECTIQKFCLPFMRFSALIASLRFDVQFVPETDDFQSEFHSLSTTLRLHNDQMDVGDNSSSTNSCLINYQSCRWSEAVKCWCKQLSSVKLERSVKYKDMLPQSHLWPKPRLLTLPKSYDKLFDGYRKQTCNRCGQIPSDPTLCLVCGAFLCYRTRCCKGDDGKYECVRHSIECGCGTGVFLVISSSVVVIIRFDRGCIWGSVYLDSFGEEDRDLRRGKPLFLSQERFNRLEDQWAGHSFDRTCKRWAAHKNEL